MLVPAALPELRLVLLGRKGAGKSAAVNSILGGVGSFESGKPTEECVKRKADVAGRRVTVVDTPGWEWYYPLNNTPNWVRRETLRSVSLFPSGPHVVLLVVRSCASVTEDYIREIEEHLEPLGKRVWEHTMLLFTRGDELGLTSMEQRILTSGPTLQGLLQKCGNRYHVVDNRSKGDASQVKELIRKLAEMVEGQRCGSSYLEVDNTVLLGLERLKDMGDRMLRQEAELKKLREREMKSIRWFFDRKKKVKSPGNTDVQREEEEDEDRRADEKRNDIGELEERIQWLTEDKEREIQDLSIEKERLHKFWKWLNRDSATFWDV
uniref:AIG1-type G domain-containing protein n=1 Tax=Mola mola TaxID=94237 RepID=A0A3Q3WWJ4_MOLML